MNTSNADITFGGIGICLVMVHLIAISNGRLFITLPAFLLIYPTVFILWRLLRRAIYIAVDLEKKTLNGALFFGFQNKIPIASIIHLGARGMMLGGLTVMTVTYVLPNGRKKIVNAGGKESLDANFSKILDALVEINPNLQIPSELRR